ncbi:glycosyl hydrolase family 18 protein [Vibrio aestuarianus]|uniref:glycosyl hydrolase family 18 protein n=1 Tax=Vibrio aestuarianus TaxID=28171 RepID=UPI00237C5711|nr:glycosyl hydrolase family 18 protein [Vibrio aestuarianus]MDE1330343.1 glycosyl hydrolase family 18 protein [Vibrio aestuarianus]
MKKTLGAAALLIAGFSLTPVAAAIAANVDIGVSASESQWWSTYRIEVENTSSTSISMNGAVLEFSLPTATNDIQWSANGLSYPSWNVTHQNTSDGVLHKVTFSYTQDSWVNSQLEAGNTFTISFGYGGQVPNLSDFEQSIKFNGDAGQPPIIEPTITVQGLQSSYELEDSSVAIDFNVQTNQEVMVHAKLVQGETVYAYQSSTVDGLAALTLEGSNLNSGSYDVIVSGNYQDDGETKPIAEQRFSVQLKDADTQPPLDPPTVTVTDINNQYELSDGSVSIDFDIETDREALISAKLVQGEDVFAEQAATVNGNMSFTLESQNLEAGHYEILVAGSYEDDGETNPLAEQRFNVELITETGSEPVAPEVSFISPRNGNRFAPGEAVSIDVTATDKNDDLVSVVVTANSEEICQFDATNKQNFNCNWMPPMEGDYQLTATAKDEKNLSSDVSVSIKVTEDLGNLSCDPAQIYREDGRECMGDDHPRRVVGYFTSWRNGSNDLPSYLVTDIPWEKITHINYAFAGLDANTIEFTLDESATEMEWPNVTGAEMDPALPYKGHFNLLNKYKKQYPDVKTILAVGGWAETGGFFSGTTNPNCTVNLQGIEKIANQSVEYIRQYGFDGIDYDYEYPTSMTDAGNPVDWPLSNQCRGQLFGNYVELMKVTREKLDKAGEEDGRKYLFTIASPSSAYLLRGMENFQVTKYLDFINLMTYDFHGTWNHFVGHNAALFDNRIDNELEAGGIYGTSQYGGIGYLNAAWAGQYFRGAVEPGKLNIGVPFYTRGWKDVQGGSNGYNGLAQLPQQSQCQDGTGMNDPCGNGAEGIDNLWHDVDENGVEIAAGVVPMWHAKNLEHAQELGLTDSIPSYGTAWGLDESNPKHLISGTYTRHFDEKAKVPWLWNAEKRVFLSTEDEESMAHKIDYVKDRGFGGLMIWELAGDYAFDEANNEYYMGDTLVTQMYEGFKNAQPYSIVHNNMLETPTSQVDIAVSVQYPEGDNNYPINPKFTLTNNSGVDIPGGTKIQFLIPTSASDTLSDWSGMGASIINSAGNDNVQGERPNDQVEDFHLAEISLPTWKALPAGGETTIDLVYYLPATIGDQGVRFLIGDQIVGMKSAFPELPAFAGDDTPGENPGNVIQWVAGQTQVSNGDIVSFGGECFKAKNNPGIWESPKAGSWFWDVVNCPQ